MESPLLDIIDKDTLKKRGRPDISFHEDETKTLDRLCFFAGVLRHFRGVKTGPANEGNGKSAAKPRTKSDTIAGLVNQFYTLKESTDFGPALLRVPVIKENGRNVIAPCFSPCVDEFVRTVGREMALMEVFSLTTTCKGKKKIGKEFVETVVSDFRREVLPRLMELWERDDVFRALNLVLGELAASPQNWKLAAVLTELMAVDLCVRADPRAGPRDPLVRQSFFCIAVLYSHLNAKWETAPDWNPATAIDTYLRDIGDSLSRRDVLATARAACERTERWNAMDERLRRCIENIHADDAVSKKGAADYLGTLHAMNGVCAYECSAEDELAFNAHLTAAEIFIVINDEDPFSLDIHVDRTPVVFEARVDPRREEAIARARQTSAIERVDSLVEAASGMMDSRPVFDARMWAEDDVEPVADRTKEQQAKKPTQSQRRKQAKKAVVQEVSAWLGELCDTVAVSVAEELEARAQEEAERLERARLEEARMEAERLERARLMEARMEAERLERLRLEQERRVARQRAYEEYMARQALERERQARAAFEEFVESLIRDVAADAVRENEDAIIRRAQEVLAQRASRGDLGGAIDLVKTLVPSLEPVLEPTLECFVCLQALDFAKDSERIRSLSCCNGGSFACSLCMAKHTMAHPMVAEQHVVLQAVCIRRRFKIGEFNQ